MATINSDSVAQDQLISFVRRIEALEDEAKAINDDKSDVYKEARGNGFDVKVLRKIIADRRKDGAERAEFQSLYDLYWDAIHGVVRAHVENVEEFPPHDAETGEIIEPTPAAQIAAGLTEALAIVKGEAEPHRVHQIPGNGAGGAETEASVANVGATASAQPITDPLGGHPQHQPSETAGDGPAKASGANKGGENVAPSPAHASEQPGTDDSSVRAPAEGDANSAAIPEPAVPLTQERGATGDESAVIPSAALVAPNVVSIRTHNPDTHFLNSKGLVRLHGCLKPEVCGSSQPRVRLCFDCSLKHDGPSPSGEVA